jgi:signal transduction histidine kinase/alkylhydroperoxidase/carboxymuconolactone decarboxylase family protein YurZ
MTAMSDRHRWSLAVVRTWWWALATVGAAMYVAALPAAFRQVADGERADFTDPTAYRTAIDGVGWDPRVLATVAVAMLVTYTVAAAGASVVIHVRRPRDPAALLVATILLAHGLGWPAVMDALEGRWQAYDVAGYLVSVSGFIGFFLLAYLFPDGRFVPRWTRWVALVFVVDTAFASAGLSATGQLPAPWSSVAESALGLTVVATMVYAVTHRYRRVSTPLERQQTRSVGLALLVLATCFVATGVLAPLSPERGVSVVWVELLGLALFTLGFAVLPIAVAIATLRRGLWGTPTVLRRALLVTTVSAVLVVAYVAVVALATSLLDGNGPAATTIGALLVALAVEPVRRAAGRWVSRLTLGDRTDAEGAVVRLSRRLDEALTPDSALPAVLSAVREAVRSPGAAVVGSGVDAVSGRAPGADAWRSSLRHQGEEVGVLVVDRRGSEDFDATDRRLLDELARSVALAVHAVQQQTQARRLAADLQVSRDAIVTAREEERRRLRRDLHDGLGPVLAGQVLRLETARDLVDADPARTRDLLDRAVVEAVSSLEEVRRVVDGLRPPTLDDDGLALAVRNRVHQLADRVEVSTTEPLPRMRAAVEVAAYHIVSEAVSNAVRHAPGARCGVTIGAVDGELVVTVADDGPGINGQARAARVGAGLTTMRERAAEIGGRLEVGPAPGGGTAVVARLPLEGPGLPTENEGARA